MDVCVCMSDQCRSYITPLIILVTGVGVGMVTVCLVLGIYTNTVLLWSLRYTVDSFQTTLPWSACPNTTTTICGLPRYTPAQYYFL